MTNRQPAAGDENTQPDCVVNEAWCQTSRRSAGDAARTSAFTNAAVGITTHVDAPMVCYIALSAPVEFLAREPKPAFLYGLENGSA